MSNNNSNFHLILIILGFCSQMIVGDCPRLCECKWKNGKESVICLNANLSVVPIHLETSTQVIDLTGNNLSIIKHDEFSSSGLINLQKIYLSKCRLKILERYAFRYLINLIELDLSYNILTTIPSHTFDSISELRELKLNGNPIQKIHNNAFINLSQLIRLELSDCKISNVEVKAFLGLEKSLEWLKLDKNKLIDVTSISFTILQNLHGLELAGNPWNCSCNLRPLREWMLRHNIPFGIPPLCHYPKRLYLKHWDKLDLDEFACVPEIFAYENKAHGVEGKNITMTCRITGIPEPSVRWLLKNKVIANLSGSSYSNGKKLYMVHLQNKSSDLTIFSADLQDAGVYICAAENKAGRAEASVTLAVIKKPRENTFSNKILIASVITGIIFVILSCLIALCVYNVRKKQITRWQNRTDCHRDDNNYEKIEMNHKIIINQHQRLGDSDGNGAGVGENEQGNYGGGGGVGVGGAGAGIVGSIAAGITSENNNGSVIGGDISLVITNRKNGDYRGLPTTNHEDIDADDDDDDNNSNKNWINCNDNNLIEKRWNSPDHLLDPEDLHIPRRTLQESRDNIKKNINSMCGTSNFYQPSTSSILCTNNINAYTTAYNIQLSNFIENDLEKKYPDLIIENSSYKFSTNTVRKANSDGGSVTDINELFCTLPRKRNLIQNTRYKSTDSQTPLLTGESRYGSSGGESNNSDGHETNFRRLSIDITNPTKKLSKISTSSYLNLCESKVPYYDNCNKSLLTKNTITTTTITTTTTPTMTTNYTYDYHAAQLEKFLEEYRCLQKQLTKMKETCDNLCQDNGISPTTPTTTNMTTSQPTVTVGNILQTTPNSNQTLQEDLRNFESELAKYLLAKNSSPIKWT